MPVHQVRHRPTDKHLARLVPLVHTSRTKGKSPAILLKRDIMPWDLGLLHRQLALRGRTAVPQELVHALHVRLGRIRAKPENHRARLHKRVIMLCRLVHPRRLRAAQALILVRERRLARIAPLEAIKASKPHPHARLLSLDIMFPDRVRPHRRPVHKEAIHPIRDHKRALLVHQDLTVMASRVKDRRSVQLERTRRDTGLARCARTVLLGRSIRCPALHPVAIVVRVTSSKTRGSRNASDARIRDPSSRAIPHRERRLKINAQQRPAR